MPRTAAAGKPRRESKSEKTRGAILVAASKLFAAKGYDAAGVREIGLAAGANPALINLYFGSKEALFAEVVRDAFDGGALLDGDRSGLGLQWAQFTVKGVSVRQKRLQKSNQALQLMIRSATSPVAAKTVRRAIGEQVVQPIAARLEGPHAQERAGLIATYLLGFSLMQRVMRMDALAGGDQEILIAHLARATQDCVDSRD